MFREVVPSETKLWFFCCIYWNYWPYCYWRVENEEEDRGACQRKVTWPFTWPFSVPGSFEHCSTLLDHCLVFAWPFPLKSYLTITWPFELYALQKQAKTGEIIGIKKSGLLICNSLLFKVIKLEPMTRIELVTYSLRDNHCYILFLAAAPIRSFFFWIKTSAVSTGTAVIYWINFIEA